MAAGEVAYQDEGLHCIKMHPLKQSLLNAVSSVDDRVFDHLSEEQFSILCKDVMDLIERRHRAMIRITVRKVLEAVFR